MPSLTIKNKVEEICSYSINTNDKYKATSFCIDILTQIDIKIEKRFIDDNYVEILNDNIQQKIDNVLYKYNITGFSMIDKLNIEAVLKPKKNDLRIYITYFSNDVVTFNSRGDNSSNPTIQFIEDIIFDIINEINSIENVKVVYSSKRKNK